MTNDTFEVHIERLKELDSVPSGSGMVILGDKIFVIGDDATSLYQLSVTDDTIRAVPILHADTSLHRIEKPVKHDLEAFTAATINGKDLLLAFGSGSVSPYRDSLLVIAADDLHQQKWIPLGQLYTQLKQMVKVKELNIEAAVVMHDAIFLFDRNSGRVFRFALSALATLIEKDGQYEVTAIDQQYFELPVDVGRQSAFSGACLLDEQHLLFSASAEASPNVYDDGDISGSYIGILSFDRGSQRLSLQNTVALKDGSGRLKDKIESIDLAGRFGNGDLRAFAIVDNDNGRSKLLELRLRFTPARQ